MRPSRAPVFAFVALLVGGVFSACSAPVPDDTPAALPPRDVRLVEPTILEPAGVSALEAGQLAAGPQSRPVATPHEHHHPSPDPALVAEVLEPAPTVSETAVLAPELVPAPAPSEPAEEPVLLVGRGVEPSYEAGPGFGLASGSTRRDPVIIIRGGRGGVDDDCDLHRPGARRIPMAINQVAPPRMSFPRGGIR